MTETVYNWGGSGIRGHEKELRELEKDLATGNLAHAYLFAGASHIGKYTLAKRMAQMLQCEEKGCGKCSICINLQKGYHPDTLEMADDGASLKIEPMREALVRLATTTAGNYKVFLVENIERMTLETANILLKTLEEPPSRVLFLFTTAHVEDVLATILSRVRVMRFRALGSAAIADLLHEKFPFEDEAKIQKISDFSFGLPGRAVFFAGHPEEFEQVLQLFERVRNVLQRNDVVEKFSLVADVTQDAKLFAEFFDIFLLALRYTMLHEAEGVQSLTASPRKLQRTVDVILQTLEALRLQKRNVNARLLFEHLMLQT